MVNLHRRKLVPGLSCTFSLVPGPVLSAAFLGSVGSFDEPRSKSTNDVEFIFVGDLTRLDQDQRGEATEEEGREGLPRSIGHGFLRMGLHRVG